LRANQVDAMIVQAKNIGKFKLDDLKAILFESYDEDDKYVVIADKDISISDLKKATL
jgi:hypothetical protein